MKRVLVTNDESWEYKLEIPTDEYIAGRYDPEGFLALTSWIKDEEWERYERVMAEYADLQEWLQKLSDAGFKARHPNGPNRTVSL